MKRTFFSMVVLVAINSGIYAQNNVFPTTGSVGIGTTSPSEKLDVVGAIGVKGLKVNGLNNGSFSNTMTAETFGGLILGGGEAIGSCRSGGDGFGFGLDFYTNYAKRMSITYSGKVGIGMTNPTEKLVVDGNIRLNNSGNGLIFFGGGEKIVGTSDWGIDFQTGSSSTSRLMIKNDGKVGIGTTSPNATLDVAGTFKAASGNFSVDNSGSITTGWISMGTDFNMKRFSAYKRALVSDGTSTNEYLTINYMNDYAGGVVVAGDKFAVNGTSTFNGQVGIGVTPSSPEEMLLVKGSTNPSIQLKSTTGWLTFGLSTCASYGCYSAYAKDGDAVIRVLNNKNLILGSNAGANGQAGEVIFVGKNTTTNQEAMWMKINKNGQVLIATDGTGKEVINDPNIKLAVNGQIYANGACMKKVNNWPDYVFNDDYKTMSLLDVEKYIKENKHLPETKSANQIETDGLDVVETMKIHMKKIEELTLYSIEQQKLIQLQTELNTKMENRVAELEKSLLK